MVKTCSSLGFSRHAGLRNGSGAGVGPWQPLRQVIAGLALNGRCRPSCATAACEGPEIPAGIRLAATGSRAPRGARATEAR